MFKDAAVFFGKVVASIFAVWVVISIVVIGPATQMRVVAIVVDSLAVSDLANSPELKAAEEKIRAAEELVGKLKGEQFTTHVNKLIERQNKVVADYEAVKRTMVPLREKSNHITQVAQEAGHAITILEIDPTNEASRKRGTYGTQIAQSDTSLEALSRRLQVVQDADKRADTVKAGYEQLAASIKPLQAQHGSTIAKIQKLRSNYESADTDLKKLEKGDPLWSGVSGLGAQVNAIDDLYTQAQSRLSSVSVYTQRVHDLTVKMGLGTTPAVPAPQAPKVALGSGN